LAGSCILLPVFKEGRGLSDFASASHVVTLLLPSALQPISKEPDRIETFFFPRDAASPFTRVALAFRAERAQGAQPELFLRRVTGCPTAADDWMRPRDMAVDR
jgi:hypothetical protein